MGQNQSPIGTQQSLRGKFCNRTVVGSESKEGSGRFSIRYLCDMILASGPTKTTWAGRAIPSSSPTKRGFNQGYFILLKSQSASPFEIHLEVFMTTSRIRFISSAYRSYFLIGAVRPSYKRTTASLGLSTITLMPLTHKEHQKRGGRR